MQTGRHGGRQEKTRQYFPAELGARHPIHVTEGMGSNDELAIFLGLLKRKWDRILPPIGRVGDDLELHYTPQHKVYDDYSRMGLAVLQKRVSARHARKHRIQWTRNDVGRIKTDIKNEIDKLGIKDDPLDVTLVDIGPPSEGDPEGQSNCRKLGAIIDPSSAASAFLVREHALVVEGLQGPLQPPTPRAVQRDSSEHHFSYPYGEYVPMFIFGQVFNNVPEEKLEKCVSAAQAMLPVTVQLDPIMFFAHQEIR